jgi:hypothetical protein
MMPVTVVTRLELTPEEAGKLQLLQFRIMHDSNEVGSSPPQPLAVTVANPEMPIYVNAVSNIVLLIPGPGRLTIAATISGAALPPLYLIAQQAPT